MQHDWCMYQLNSNTWFTWCLRNAVYDQIMISSSFRFCSFSNMVGMALVSHKEFPLCPRDVAKCTYCWGCTLSVAGLKHINSMKRNWFHILEQFQWWVLMSSIKKIYLKVKNTITVARLRGDLPPSPLHMHFHTHSRRICPPRTGMCCFMRSTSTSQEFQATRMQACAKSLTKHRRCYSHFSKEHLTIIILKASLCRALILRIAIHVA